MRCVLFLVVFIMLICNLLLGVEIQEVTYIWKPYNPTNDCDLSGAINIGDKIIFKITLSENVTNTNVATIDIGTLYQNIQLYNDGNHNDGVQNDNIFACEWVVKEGTSVYEATITGNYWDNGIKKSKYCDKTISFDAERPVINNINVSPNAFNPYVESCEIAYTMSETVNNVVVKIYTNLSLSSNALVKTLPKPPGDAGDNFVSWWDGKDESGEFVQTPPDRDYYIHISCRDLSGNYSQAPTASVKISTVKIEIVGFNTTPTPVTPDGDMVNDILYVNTKIMMYSWDGISKHSITVNQMKNLGFTAGSNWSKNSSYADGDLLELWPYAKVGFILYTASGEKIFEYGQDLDPDSDFDTYYFNKFHSNLIAQFGTNIAADGDEANDWETLVPFYDDGLDGNEIDYGGGASQEGDGIFTSSHSFGIKLTGDWNDGVYIVRGTVELTGIHAEITEGESGYVVHFTPAWKGGYIVSQPAQTTFVVDVSGVNGVDSIQPYVVSVYPENGSKISYAINSVMAYLQDNIGGSGIDLLKSDIYLADKYGHKIAGRKINNGADVIIWELNEPLNTKGKYFIYVLPVDKRGNQPAEYYKYSFEADIIGDTSNLITVTEGGVVIGDLGRIYLSVPPYAVEQNMRITVFKPFSFPGEQEVYGGCQFMPSSVEFQRPVRITLYYTDSDLSKLPTGVPESALRIYNWQNNKWVYLGGNVNTIDNSVSVSGIRSINGYYALLPETTGGIPTSVISDVQVDKPFKQNGYISFKVSNSIASLRLLIYTLDGSLIKEVPIDLETINNAGYYDITWDLIAGDGSIVNNGIYVFRFIAKRTDGKEEIVSKAIPVIK